MLAPPIHTDESLEKERRAAIDQFRRERLEEPVEEYHDLFDIYQGVVEDLLEATVDLTALDEHALDVMSDSSLLEAFRYMAGPPISTDDLKTVSEADSLRPSRLAKDPETLLRIIGVIRDGLDRRRFAWVSEKRDPTEAEKHAAVLASAALMTTQRLQTTRRHTGQAQQEQRVEDTLTAAGLNMVATRRINVLSQAPRAGEFCRESYLGSSKADFVVGLWDARVMALECKVSNSATNSVKRLNRDTASKAEEWRRDFGTIQVVPAAILSGVYKHHNLLNAQGRGLSIFWAHDLGALVDWIQRTRQQ